MYFILFLVEYLKVKQIGENSNKTLTNIRDSTNAKWKLESVNLSATSDPYSVSSKYGSVLETNNIDTDFNFFFNK